MRNRIITVVPGQIQYDIVMGIQARLSNELIVRRAVKKHESKTTVNCVKWYRSKLRNNLIRGG